MDISPNITLFVQMLNFLGMYWAVRALLVKPVLAELEKEHQEETHIKAQIAANELVLATQRKELHLYVQTCQKNIAAHIPPAPKPFVTHPAVVVPIKEISNQEVQRSITAITDSFIKKVINVR